MAAFIAKQVVGKQLDSVKGALGGKEDEKKAEGSGDEDPDVAEAKREAEERRNEMYKKMEEERERMRQDIRDKYGIRKKDLAVEQDVATEGGRSRRKSKTAEAGVMDGTGDSDSLFPRSLSDLSSRVSDLPGKMAATVTDATDKCVLQ